MCLAVPGEIKKIEGDVALADFGGVEVKVNLSLIENPKVGDWILNHAGVAIHKMTKKEAEDIFKAFEGEI